MVAVLLWVRAELRARWRSWAGLVLVIGLAGGAVLTATAGARRTASSVDRFRDEAGDPQARVFNPVGEEPLLLDAVEGLPGVAASGRLAVLLFTPVGSELRAGYDVAVLAPQDDRILRTIERPRVLRGRLPATDRADEVAVNEALARRLDVAVGDRLDLEGPTPEEATACFETAACNDLRGGPAPSVVVVGITRSVSELDDRAFGSFQRGLLAGGAFFGQHGDRAATPGTMLSVRLTGGEAAVPAFTAAVAGISERLEVQPGQAGAVDDALRVQVLGLLGFAVIAGLAGLVAIGQAYARLTEAAAPGIATLGVLGAGRGQRWSAAVGPLVITAPVGAAQGVATAWLASPLLPIGLGRRAEPHPGLSFDAVVLGMGGLAVVVAVVVRAAGSALRLAGRPAGDVTQPPDRAAGPGAMTRVLALRQPAALPVGARMALAQERSAAVPVGSTLLGAVVGVAGFVGALTFDRSADHLRSDAALYGAPWSAQIGMADDPAAVAAARVAADRAGPVEALALVGEGRLRADGRPDVLAIAVKPERGGIASTLLSGRGPVAPDEVVVGGDLLRALGRDVGDTIRLGGDAGEGTYRVVGRGSVPIIENDSRTDGLVLTMDGLERLVATTAGEEGRTLLVRWAPGVELAAAHAVIVEAGFLFDPPFVPTEVDNLRELGAIPEALAAFLAALGLAAAAHGLAVTARRRRRDLAVLRALGFTVSDTRWTVACQAMTTAAVALVVGIPVGLVAGRSAWSSVAERLEVVDRPAVPVLALLLVVPAGLALVNLLAFLPGRAAAGPRPAVVLRGE